MMKQNGEFIKFICPKCKTTESIPTKVVEMLDEMDSIGTDLSIPPRFDCEKCDGKMVPIHYISVNGTVHTYEK